MLGREMCIPPHHLRAFPPAQLLQGIRRRAVLHTPAGPGVPQVMPAEVLDTRAVQRLIPSLRADLSKRRTTEARIRADRSPAQKKWASHWLTQLVSA